MKRIKLLTSNLECHGLGRMAKVFLATNDYDRPGNAVTIAKIEWLATIEWLRCFSMTNDYLGWVLDSHVRMGCIMPQKPMTSGNGMP